MVGRASFAAVVLFVAFATGHPAAQKSKSGKSPQVRDRLSSNDKSVTVRGRVVDAVSGRPVARARVAIYGGEALREFRGASMILRTVSQSVVAGIDGRFEFRDIPPTRVQMSAEKGGYIPGRYPDRPRDTIRTRSIDLAAGQSLDDITIRLYRLMAISGRVTDQFGDPIEQVQVHAWRVSAYGSAIVSAQSAATNDIGDFRLNRLEPGRYLVGAMPGGTMYENAERPMLGTTFFPGVAGIDQAQPIELARGGSVDNIDLTLIELPQTSISGAVVDADGQPTAGGGVTAFAVVPHLNLQRRPVVAVEQVAMDGTFTLRVPPGEYDLHAITGFDRVRGGHRYRVTARVLVGPEPLAGVSLVAAPPAALSGRLVVEKTTKGPIDPQRLELQMTAVREGGDDCSAATRIDIKPDWTFAQSEVNGRCVVRLTTEGWMLKSVRLGDADLTGRPIEFQPGRDVRDLQIVATDRMTAIVPTVTDGQRGATDEYVVVAFAEEPSKFGWNDHSRYVATYTPEFDRRPDGAAARRGLRGMQPGSYYVIALEDVAYADMSDPAFLESLIPRATRVTVSEGERRTVTLRRLALPQ